MEKVQQFEPITHMQTKPTAILAKLADGPVILAQRSKPAAVLVSVEQWDSTAALLEDLMDTVDMLEEQLRIARGETELMSQTELDEWLHEDEQVLA